MKKAVLLVVLMLGVLAVQAQALDVNATYIKKNFSADYEATLKKHALAKWKENFSMVVYEIDKQADALVELIDNFKSPNTSIVLGAIKKWGIDGYKSSNLTILKKLKTFELKQLLKLHCNWSMVKYEYDKQVKARESF